jgi:hypothetical protein
MFLDKINLHLLLICGLFGTAPLWAVELKEAEITTIKNIVEHDSGTGPAPAKQSDMIHEKSKVSTEAASMAELTFGDSTITRMGANTMFSFQSKERLVKLDRGTVLINTPPGAGGATVDCGGVTGAVTGTTFLASRAGDGKVMFVLLEGSPMKITSGGVVTTIKPGQVASVGVAAPEGGDKAIGDKGGGDKGGGDKASGDKGGADKGGGDKTGGDQGGGDKPTASGGGGDKGPATGGGGDKPTSSGGGGEKGGPAPAPTEKPRPVQVFDVDVKKMVDSTPLIRDFAKPLPSAEKIQATVQVQQNKVSEGKMESLGMEVVAVKADGDLLVGAPKVVAEAPPKKEEPKADAPAKKEDVVAKKEEVAGKKEDGGMKPEPKADPKMAGGPAPDNLDISTAAGGPAPSPQGAPAPKPVAIALPPPAPVNPVSSIVGQIIAGVTSNPDPTLVGRAPAGTIVIGDPLNPLTISLSSGLKSAARAVFTVTVGGRTVGGSFNVAAGATSFSILGSSIPDPKIYSKGQSAVVTLTLPGAIGTITQTIQLDSRPSDDPVVQAANPLRSLVDFESPALESAFNKYFYFEGSVAGSPGALAKYFVDAPMFVELGNTQKVELGTSAQDFDFFAAQATKLTQNLNLGAMPLTGGRSDVFFYATRQEMGLASAKFFGTVSLSGVPTMSYDNSSMDLWEGSWADWRNVGGTIQGGVIIDVPSSKEKVGFVAGTGGISIQGVTVNANGAALEVLTSGDLLVQAASFLDLSPVRETSIQSLGVIQVGATTEELAALATIETSAGRNPIPAQEALQEQKQVRIESRGSVSSAGVASSSGIAVIRSETGLEMRDVVIRGFDKIELVKGLKSDSLAPRVLVSGSSVRDFKIKELVGAFINADSKIQMAALDASGELAGTMVVQNGLPVSRQLAGVLDSTLTDSRKNLLVDAQTVSLAAKRLEFQNSTIAAMSAITARASTVLLNNANFTVISQNGMINFYTRQGLVNRTYGSDGGSDNGMLNFSGVNNFRIGTTSFTVQDQATLNQHYGSNILDINQNGNRPEAGKVNVLKM